MTAAALDTRCRGTGPTVAHTCSPACWRKSALETSSPEAFTCSSWSGRGGDIEDNSPTDSSQQRCNDNMRSGKVVASILRGKPYSCVRACTGGMHESGGWDLRQHFSRHRRARIMKAQRVRTRSASTLHRHASPQVVGSHSEPFARSWWRSQYIQGDVGRSAGNAALVIAMPAGRPQFLSLSRRRCVAEAAVVCLSGVTGSDEARKGVALTQGA